MRVLAFCVLLVQAGTGVAMPPQPDFSGHWELVVTVPSDASVPTLLDVRQTVRRATVRGEPMAPFCDRIAIVRQGADGTTRETVEMGIVGGVVSRLPGTSGRETHHAATWDRADGRTLVFEHGAYTGDRWQPHDWTERRETWALQPNGELAIDVVTSGSADRVRTVSATYRRE